MTEPCIEIRQDGPLFRVDITPADALPQGWLRPESFANRPLARMGARLISDATGLPIVDRAKVGS